jgi:hypothetical protein
MKKLCLTTVLATLALASMATIVPKGTDVRLAFDDGITTKTARAGDKVSFHVVDDVVIDGQVVIKKGTAATGTVGKVERGRRFGVNARLQIKLDPIVTEGNTIPIATRLKGKRTGGGTDKAGMASGAGMLVLGPVGLGIGYFITGKDVKVNPGDTMITEVTADTDVKASAAPGGIQNAGQSAGGS